VSGVTFQVQDWSPKIEIDGKTVFFCCSGSEFTKNRQRVIELRKNLASLAVEPR
jgi:hypothetical protein